MEDFYPVYGGDNLNHEGYSGSDFQSGLMTEDPLLFMYQLSEVGQVAGKVVGKIVEQISLLNRDINVCEAAKEAIWLRKFVI